jgi:hypothetical protein
MTWAGAEERSVPTEYNTIQAAIDSSTDGDTVLVAPGTYTGVGNRDLDFGGADIVLLSTAGAELTTIDCQSQGAGLLFHNGESSAARVEGFTIYNASAGGIVCLAAGPSIVNCVITGNSPSGVVCNQAAPTLSACIIAGNDSGGAGGGIYCYSASSPAIVACVITGNRAATCGGGIYCSTSSPFIISSTISRNEAADGGGICCRSASFPTMEQSILWGNCAASGYEVHNAFGCVISFACCAIDNQGVSGVVEYNGRQVTVDPLFCGLESCGSAPTTDGDYALAADSPCLPQNSPCNMLIGALESGCAETPVARRTWGSFKSDFRW